MGITFDPPNFGGAPDPHVTSPAPQKKNHLCRRRCSRPWGSPNPGPRGAPRYPRWNAPGSSPAGFLGPNAPRSFLGGEIELILGSRTPKYSGEHVGCRGSNLGLSRSPTYRPSSPVPPRCRRRGRACCDPGTCPRWEVGCGRAGRTPTKGTEPACAWGVEGERKAGDLLGDWAF